MAKRKSNKAGRDVTTHHHYSPPIAKRTLSLLRPLEPLPHLTTPTHHPALGDRRRYDPTRHAAPPIAAKRSASRIVAPHHRWTALRFNVPEKVAICVRRKQRKEVLHAKLIAGKGARSFKRRRSNFWSKVSCK